MWNAEYKTRFIEDNGREWRKYEFDTSFASFHEVELETGKDVGEMEIDELKQAILRCEPLIYSEVIARIRILNAYLVWYSMHVAPVDIQKIKISYKDIDLAPVLKKNTIRGVEEIPLYWHDRLPSEGDFQQVAIVLAFYGFPLKDQALLTQSDVIENGNEILVIKPDKTIAAITDPTAVRIIRDYIHYKGHKDPVTGIYYNRIDGGQLFYTKRSENVAQIYITRTPNNIQKNIHQYAERKGDTSQKYSFVSLLRAGEYYNIVQFIKANGHDPDLADQGVAFRSSVSRKSAAEVILASAKAYARAHDLL